MALKLYVKLQNPIIELPIKAKGGEGIKDSFIVAFNRYPLSEARAKLDKMQEMYKELDKDDEKFSSYMDSVLRNEIVYIKGIKIDTVDDETDVVREVHIPDTRNAKPIETLWGSPDECLAVLLDSLLECGPIRVSLNSALTKALLNTDFEEDAAKN